MNLLPIFRKADGCICNILSQLSEDYAEEIFVSREQNLAHILWALCFHKDQL